MIPLNERPYLFVDETLCDMHDGTSLRLHQPRRENVSLMTNAPWEGPTSGYYSIVDAGDTYLMYYRGSSAGVDMIGEVTCVAESSDGVNWSRRLTWQYTVNGSRANNIVWANERMISHNMAPFYDANPDCPEDMLFKAVGGRDVRSETPDGVHAEGLFALVSPDGFTWRLLSDEPIITIAGLDSLNQAFYDTEIGKYVLYSRLGHEGFRAVERSTSDDMLHWSPREVLDYSPGLGAPDADPSLEHFYTNAIRPYDRDPGLYLGFPQRFATERALFPDWHGGPGVSDCVMIASRDGLHFPRRFREAFVRPGLDQMNWNERNIMMAPGMIRTSPTEYSLYWSEHSRRHDARLQRGTIRVDGFASLHADWPGGSMLSNPVMLDGDSLVLNMSTSAAGSVRVEIEDEAGTTVPGCGTDDCDEVYGDDIERIVTWNGSPDISRVKGQKVRLRMSVVDGDVYSVCSV
jgi:hypothetical protein